jgi:hypothetical protein
MTEIENKFCSIDESSNLSRATFYIIHGKVISIYLIAIENCIIKCFNLFSNVLLKLKPNSFDFSTNSLSKNSS